MTTEERKAEDARFRQEYPLFAQYPELIYLDNAATTQKPSCVIQAESAFYEKYNANPFRGVYELAEFATEHYEEARAAVAELLHANTDEIVFTRNASESLNLIAYSLGNLVLRPGDEVLVSIMEHHSNLLVWQQAAKRTGATLRYLDCTQDGKITAEMVEAAVTDKTKIFAVTQISNVLGWKNDIKSFAEICHRKGCLIVADGAQSVYQVEVTVQPEQETMAPESGQNVPPGDQLAGNATAKPQVDASEEEMRIEKQRMQYIVGIMAAFCGLLILGIISLIRRYRSQNLK